jgi:hypothetical protein
VISRYLWLSEADATEIPYGGERGDFEYLKKHPRKNLFFDREDGLFHVSYVGRGGADMVPALSAVFQAVRLGLQRSSDLFSRLRMHFVGTTYAPDASGAYQVLPLAEQFGLRGHVDEHPGRVPYLDALQTLLDSHALLAVGSDRPHYTASKIFPYILAGRPLLAVFHEASSVVAILDDTRAGRLVTFDEANGPDQRVEEIGKHLKDILVSPSDDRFPTLRETFDPHSARSMAKRLAGVFTAVVSHHEHA